MEFDFGLYRYNMHAKTFGVGVGCCDDPTAMQAGRLCSDAGGGFTGRWVGPGARGDVLTVVRERLLFRDSRERCDWRREERRGRMLLLICSGRAKSREGKDGRQPRTTTTTSKVQPAASGMPPPVSVVSQIGSPLQFPLQFPHVAAHREKADQGQQGRKGLLVAR